MTSQGYVILVVITNKIENAWDEQYKKHLQNMQSAENELSCKIAITVNGVLFLNVYNTFISPSDWNIMIILAYTFLNYSVTFEAG